ncbi:MAG: cell division protein ZapA [Clostridia bacterium]|nr:cell division protein ZapA [Clostridia bacterium]
MERQYNINICGYQCNIVSDESKEEIDRAIAAVTERVKAITDNNDRISTSMAALLVCMDLYEELEENKMATGNLRMQLKAYFDDAARADDEKHQLQKEIASLKARLGE